MINRITLWYHRHRLEIFVGTLAALMLFLATLPYTMISIKAGNEGVLWHRFSGGTKLHYSFKEGTTLIWPWDTMAIYNMRLQQISSQYYALSSNGLHITIDVTFRFKPRSSHLPALHKFIGPDYVDVLIIPKMGSNVRNVISRYEPETLYSTQRSAIEDKILQSIQNDQLESIENVQHLMREYVIFEDVVITNIKLPATVQESIEFKEQTKQRALTYEHRLEIERQEKLRKKIEAEGIRDFQNTISDGISDRYLTWKGIDATLKLAESDNSKVVVIGSGEDGLPLILGGDYTGPIPLQSNEDEGSAASATLDESGSLIVNDDSSIEDRQNY